MSDKKRIDKIVEELRKLWHKNPDMRLGQLMINYVFPFPSDCFESTMWLQRDVETELSLKKFK